MASATVPDPDLCSVLPCDTFGSPAGAAPGMVVYPEPIVGGTAAFTVNVRNADNDPIPDAFVELIFGTPANHYMCPDLVLTGTTDLNGNVDFNLSMGGCTISPNAVKVRANGLDIRTYENVKSMDYAGGSDGKVDLGDFIGFGADFSAGAPGCYDFFNDGTTGLEEFIAVGEGWAHDCTD
jgi:hypothetical protein